MEALTHPAIVPLTRQGHNKVKKGTRLTSSNADTVYVDERMTPAFLSRSDETPATRHECMPLQIALLGAICSYEASQKRDNDAKKFCVSQPACIPGLLLASSQFSATPFRQHLFVCVVVGLKRNGVGVTASIPRLGTSERRRIRLLQRRNCVSCGMHDSSLGVSG